MIQTDTGQNKRLSCYLCDEQSQALIQGIPLETYGFTLEVHDGGIAFAIEHLKSNRSPDVIIVDISKSQMPISDLASLAEVCEPRVEVIVIGEKNDVSLFRNLTRSGVRDYLVKPLLNSIITNALAEIVRPDGAANSSAQLYKSGKVIAVMGSVGGIGVSSIVANLGVSLSENHDKRVVLTDFDLQLGTLPLYLNLETTEGFSNIFISPDRIDDVLVERYTNYYNPKLGVLSSELSISENFKAKYEGVVSLFNILTPRFHYTVVDLPRQYSTGLVSSVFERANQLVILTDYSIIGLRETSRILQMTQNYPGLNQGIIIIANKVGQYQSGSIDRNAFEESLQRKITLEIGFDNIYPLQALAEGEPIVMQGKGVLYEGVQALVGLLLGIQSNTEKSHGMLATIKNLIMPSSNAK